MVEREKREYSTEKMYDLNSPIHTIFVKKHTKNNKLIFLVDNKYFDFLIATHLQELESQ